MHSIVSRFSLNKTKWQYLGRSLGHPGFLVCLFDLFDLKDNFIAREPSSSKAVSVSKKYTKR